MQETTYRGVKYNAHLLDDGRWQWFIPEGNFGGLEDSQDNAVAEAKKNIDGWLASRPNKLAS